MASPTDKESTVGCELTEHYADVAARRLETVAVGRTQGDPQSTLFGGVA